MGMNEIYLAPAMKVVTVRAERRILAGSNAPAYDGSISAMEKTDGEWE